MAHGAPALKRMEDTMDTRMYKRATLIFPSRPVTIWTDVWSLARSIPGARATTIVA